MNLKTRRILMTLGGVSICALSVGFFKRAAFGTDPFQCFAAGMANVIPIPFGTLYLLISLAMLLMVWLLDRGYVGIATFINLFLTGYLVEFSTNLLARWLPVMSMPLRAGFLLVGVVTMCLASSLYFTANLGVSVYDALALIVNKRTRAPFRFVRIGTDLVCVAIGFALGAQVGVGTLITALFMGPLIDFFNRKVAQPLLRGTKTQQEDANWNSFS